MKVLPPIIKASINHSDLVKYAGASGDFNAIHTVSHVAIEKGYPDVIVHGMYLMGVASQAIEEWFPNRRLHRFSVRFIMPSYTGENLTIKGAIPKYESSIETGKIEIINSENEIKLTGHFEMKE